MNKRAILAVVSAAVTIGHSVPAYAQLLRRSAARLSPQPSFSTPVPGPVVAHPPRVDIVHDARGNAFRSVGQGYWHHQPLTGQWLPGRTQMNTALSLSQQWPRSLSSTARGQTPKPGSPARKDQVSRPGGTTNQNPPSSSVPTPPQPNSPGPLTGGGLVDGATAATDPGSQSSTEPPWQQPPSSNPPTAVTAPPETNVAGNPGQVQVIAEPRAFYAANLGIYYFEVRNEKDRTFGAKIARMPVKGTPAASLRLDMNDVIFSLNGEPFKDLSDIIKHFGPTTVSYRDSWTYTIQDSHDYSAASCVLTRHVERKALRADLVERAEDWRWGSLGARRVKANGDRPPLAPWPIERPRGWTVRMNRPFEPKEEEAVRRSIQRG